MARLVFLAFTFGLLPYGLAGPACAEKYKTAADCMQKCNLKWGFPGRMMGTNAWGSVMSNAGPSDEAWNNYIALACGEPETFSSTSTSSTVSPTATTESTQLVHQGLGTQPVSSSSVTSTSSRFITSTRSSTTSTTTHSTTSTTSSVKPTTTSTSSTKEAPKATLAVTTHSTTSTSTTTQAKATTTSSSSSNSNSNSNSNSGSSSSNSNSANSGTTSTTSSSSSSGGNGSNASDDDVQAYLTAHNTIRAQHGAVAVTWSNAAAEKAQQWANECTNTHSGGTLGPLGENLAAGTGTFTIAQAVKAWTDEVSKYNPNDPQPSHFTQVVWKATTEIGCAVQTCDGIFAGFGPAQYYVCEYSPQGNVIGEFAENVQA